MEQRLGPIARLSRYLRGDDIALGSRAGAEQRNMTVEDVPAVMLRDGIGGRGITPASGLQIADAYACIRALADAAASVPLIPYRRGESGRERIERGATADLLERPAPHLTQADLIGQIVVHLNSYGNAFVGKYRERGRIVQLGLLDPARMQVKIVGGQPLYVYSGPYGQQQKLTSEDVIHVKMTSADGVLGLSPVRQARVVLGLSDELAEYSASFFANDARPGGILRLKRYAGGESEDMTTLERKFNEGHRGTKNAHKIAVIGGEAEFIPFSMPLDDAQFLEQRKLSAVEVARIFRVPPWLIGADAGQAMTYSNTEQQDLQFVKYGLRSSLVPIEQAFANDRDLFRGSEYAEFLIDALLRADSKTRAEVYSRALDPITGWLSREEVREMENLKAEPRSAAVPPLEPSLNGNGGAP